MYIDEWRETHPFDYAEKRDTVCPRCYTTKFRIYERARKYWRDGKHVEEEGTYLEGWCNNCMWLWPIVKEPGVSGTEGHWGWPGSMLPCPANCNDGGTLKEGTTGESSYDWVVCETCHGLGSVLDPRSIGTSGISGVKNEETKDLL